MRQPPGHGIANDARTPVALAPLVGLRDADDPAGRHRPVRRELLTDDAQTELVEAAERGDVGTRVTSVGHVEVFLAGRVRAPILRRPRSLSPHRWAAHHTLFCDEPVKPSRPCRPTPCACTSPQSTDSTPTNAPPSAPSSKAHPYDSKHGNSAPADDGSQESTQPRRQDRLRRPRSPATKAARSPGLEAVVRIAETFDDTVDYLVLLDAPRRPLHALTNALTDQLAAFATLPPDNQTALLKILDALATKTKIRALTTDASRRARRSRQRSRPFPAVRFRVSTNVLPGQWAGFDHVQRAAKRSEHPLNRV